MNIITRSLFPPFIGFWAVTLCSIAQASNTFPTSGNVGIGTSSPTSLLQVTTAGYDWKTMPYTADLSVAAGTGGWARDYRIFSSSATTNKVYFGATGGAGTATRAYWVMGAAEPETTGYLLASGIHLLSSGNVGIGTASPTAKFYVNSGDNTLASVLATNVEGPGELRVRSYTTQPSNVQAFALLHSFYNDENNGSIKFYRGISSGGGFLTLGTSGSERVRIDSAGNVGIGTVNPTYPLSVNGTVRAKEVIVDTAWSDYVLANNYKLETLSEIERQIKTERHLSGIPSAKEVAEKGISVGEMQAKLLAKIEELTLHQIEQEKRLGTQQDEILKLSERNSSLEERVARITN